MPDDVFSDFIKHEDEDGEGKGWKPPVDLEWVHLQHLVHTRSVGQEGSKTSLKDQSKVEDVIPHTLVEDRVLPCLADNEIRPLNNNNCYKEGCVASVLENLPILVSPLLTIRILQVIDGRGVPVLAESKQVGRQESIFYKKTISDETSSEPILPARMTV